MNKILENLDAKSITTIVTSVGGVVLAGFAIWGLIQANSSLTNQLTEIRVAIEESSKVIRENTEVVKSFQATLNAFIGSRKIMLELQDKAQAMLLEK